ncbi:MAG: 30S ribosome-binding factor RbfA [Candidatus Contendobacter sp.]
MALSTVPRTRRIGEQIRRDLAELIRTELRDPRLTLVSTTSVEVSRDLSYARIYVTAVGASAQRVELVTALNQAAPLLRRELGRRLRTRTVPKLEFRYDEVVEQGARLAALIEAAVATDTERHQQAQELPDEAVSGSGS